MSRPSLPTENQPTKLWQPADFGGLSLEKFQGPMQDLPLVLIRDYGVQVVFSANGKVRYGKTQQIVKITQPTVLVQNPGETWAYEPLDDTPLIVRNFDIPGEVFSHFLDKDVLFRFPNLFLNNPAVNHHLARLTLQAFDSFETPTSRLEKDSLLAQLLNEAFKQCADIQSKEDQTGAEHRAVRVVKEFLHTSPEKD
ncbi:MAG: AraC family ligand binding domain-containing protein, partial [Trueperaceae bacterium]